jgi:hypothetical protein
MNLAFWTSSMHAWTYLCMSIFNTIDTTLNFSFGIATEEMANPILIKSPFIPQFFILQV